MSGSPKQKLHAETAEEVATDEREVYLPGGRTLTITDEQLVEIRNESGTLELRIKLTDEGPVLQMESVKLQLKASESVEIESRRVAINGTEQLDLRGGEIEVSGEEDVTVDAKGEVRVRGKTIWLN